MALLPGGPVNIDEVPSTDFPIPEGTYTAMIVDSEVKATSKGTGHYLKLTFMITDAEYYGRKIWENLNLDNPNAQAVSIAKRTLKSISNAIGIEGEITDSEELHGQDMYINVVVTPERPPYAASNAIKKYLPI